MLRKIAASLLFVYALGALAYADELARQPYAGVTYSYEASTNPPQRIYEATVDLTRPGIVVRVARGGPDPDGNGPWQTTLMQPTKIADREKFDVVINGDFFEHFQGKDAEGQAALSQFKAAAMARVTGIAETDGVVWARAGKDMPMLVIDARGIASIAIGKEPPREAKQAIAGHDTLVHGGKNVAPVSQRPGFVKGPHPRTAVGIKDHGNTLILVVVDGRKKGAATGMSLAELAEVFVAQRAEEAINLDGGGSSVLAIRDPKTHQMVILNHPSDGRERPVANTLGISIGQKAR
jgi:exopolysaccharide biosynthesis protein